jgi:Flp pilus assembly protein TadD
MNLQQARKAARPLGVGAVAIGSVRQNGSQCTLEWKVYDVGSGAQIGATPKISGSREQLRKGLPGAARALARTLNLPVAALPSSVELSVDDLTVIGGTGWSQAEELPAATYRRLKQLAARSPLAVVHVAQNVMWQEPMEYSIFAAKAEATAKGNTLAIGELVRVDPAGDLGFLAEIEKLVARYPGNYVLGKASARFARGLESTFDAVALAEAGTRNAPGNADAWLALSQALLNKAQSFRKGVYFNQMTEEQISAVVPLYERAVAAAERAVERDPLWPLTWNELSVAAAFASDSRADKAYRKALALDPDDQDILWWGLELYQPKWLDDPEMLRKVAAIAASKDYRWPQWNYRLSQSLLRAGFKREAQVMLQRALASNKRYVERHPNDLTLRLEFARALKRYGRPAEARVQEQAAERIARERGIHLVGKPSP